MKYHAVEGLDSAIERTKKLLFPFRLGFWLRLALVLVLIGSGGGGGGPGGGSPSNGRSFGSGSSSYGSLLPAIGAGSSSFGNPAGNPFSGIASNILLLALIIAVIVAFVLVFMYLSSVSQFVYVKALVTGDLKLIGYYRSQAGNGLKLFLFHLAMLFVLFGLVAAAILAAIAAYAALKGSTFLLIFIGVVAIAAFVAVLIALFVFMWLVTELAVPVMYARDLGIFAGIGKVKAIASEDTWQFAVYLVLRIALGLCGWIVKAVISLVFYAPIFLVFFMARPGSAFSGASDGLTFALLLALIPVMLAIEYVVSLITLPVSVFLRYVSLEYLNRTDPSLKIFSPAQAKGRKQEKEEKGSKPEKEEKVKVF